jgi:hypothetical protein
MKDLRNNRFTDPPRSNPCTSLEPVVCDRFHDSSMQAQKAVLCGRRFTQSDLMPCLEIPRPRNFWVTLGLHTYMRDSVSTLVTPKRHRGGKKIWSISLPLSCYLYRTYLLPRWNSVSLCHMLQLKVTRLLCRSK